MLLELAFVNLSDVIYVLVVYICSCSIKTKRLPDPCWILSQNCQQN